MSAGFKAQLPLTDDRTNFNIALSSYRGHIYPSQGIVLYFSVNVLPTADDIPYLGPLALYFLRSNQRSILDSLDASQKRLISFFMGMFLRRVLKFLVIIIGSFVGAVFLVIQWMQARQYIQGQVDWNRVGSDTMVWL